MGKSFIDYCASMPRHFGSFGSDQVAAAAAVELAFREGLLIAAPLELGRGKTTLAAAAMRWIGEMRGRPYAYSATAMNALALRETIRCMGPCDPSPIVLGLFSRIHPSFVVIDDPLGPTYIRKSRSRTARVIAQLTHEIPLLFRTRPRGVLFADYETIELLRGPAWRVCS